MIVETGPGPSTEAPATEQVDGSINDLQQQLEEVQIDSSSNRKIVEFCTTSGPDNRVVCKAAIMFLEASHLPKPWKQVVTPKMFEVMHGLSRVTMLLPDKLATALVIYNESLPDPDDGKFLVELVADLVVFYRNKLAILILPSVDNENTVSRIEQIGGEIDQEFKAPDESVGLSEILDDFLDKMSSMGTNLTLRNEAGVHSDAHEILRMADDLLEFSIVYMDFVNPICLNVERKGFFDENRIQELRSELNIVLDENKKKLQEEFDLLTKPKTTEE